VNAISNNLHVAPLLANFFDAGGANQVLVGDASQAQYQASRLARTEVEKCLRIIGPKRPRSAPLRAQE
jgi:hypothetical protein